jgi:small subunit ribosomal protein S1
VADYGAFLEVAPGVEGLIHVSEMSWSQHMRNPQDFMNVGDEIEAVVLTIDREERKMSLGIKQLTPDPWTNPELLKKYAVGTKHTGIVRNMTNFGLFIELEEGIDGLVHITDLSWTKKIKHPSEVVKLNEKIDVMVLELDAENRRLALGHKQLEENPWDTFETIFYAGSTHRGTILNKSDKNAYVELPYGIEGVCALKNLTKEDGSHAEIGETLDFKVIEFSKDEKKITLSHVATYHKEEEKEKKSTAKGGSKKKKEESTESATIANVKATSLLGDNEALTALKEQMTKKD